MLSAKHPDIKFDTFKVVLKKLKNIFEKFKKVEQSPLDFELAKLSEMRSELREQRERDKRDLHDELRLRDSRIEHLQVQLKQCQSSQISRNRLRPIRKRLSGSVVACCGEC